MSNLEHSLSDLLERHAPETPEAALRMARRYAVGLLAMNGAAGAVAALTVSPAVPEWTVPPELSEEMSDPWALVFGLLGCGAVGMGWVFPFLVSRLHPFRSAAEPRKHFDYLLSRLVVGLCLNGGALVVNLVGGLITGTTVPFVYAAAASLSWIVLHFPTRRRFGVPA